MGAAVAGAGSLSPRYPSRSDSAGCTRDARRAGSQQASAPTASIDVATAPKVSGSPGSTP